MLLAELTFTQELVKGAASALSTAVFVTVIGGIAVSHIGKSREDRRQRFELRTSLLDRTSRSAGTMFIACQHASRVLKAGPSKIERDAIIAKLEEAYQRFSVEAGALENELGARFGFHYSLPAEATSGASRVFERWHQLNDLLTVYCFNLKGHFPGDFLSRNTRGYDGRFHCGLDLFHYGDNLAAMRVALRKEYRMAREDLVQRLLVEELVTG